MREHRLAVLAAAALLAGCAQERPEPAAEPAPTVAPPDTGTAALDLGEPRTGRAVTTTLTDVRPGAGSLDLELEQCLSPDVEQDPDAPLLSTDASQWVVVGADGGETAGEPVAQTPRPAFPVGTALVPGECVSGWLGLAVADGTADGAADEVERVAWRPEGVATAEWLLP
ncbi:hypothetical protein [Nocardioides flavescens]|uniref:Lipoprotein n=1 Tax=Nocardioides flavescens TaxID=2691959 RepID=A0A6L7F182_9ACTN|nr:hypothetical protein [Nocardioides flavescens]MXG90112.1 hypothetical protein [Nocardioides flavescens]